MLYTDNPFDRADQIRKDHAQIDALWSRPDATLLPSLDGKFWVDQSMANGDTRIVTLTASQHSGENSHRVFLGFYNDVAWFALDYSDHSFADSLPIPAHAELLDLRAAGPQLSSHEAAIAAYAKAVLYWHQQSLFCQVCGHAKQIKNAGHVKLCSNPACAKETFPRTDPAVIMLVIDKTTSGPARCLLGRSPNWPNGVYSTLAGFVEPGETLENAVRREVFEEAGIEVGAVQYVSSQPWPFPQSMMLGFHAVATSTAINIDYDEIADAAWFTRAQLAEFGNWGDDRFELQLPRPDSISRHLIDLWLTQSED